MKPYTWKTSLKLRALFFGIVACALYSIFGRIAFGATYSPPLSAQAPFTLIQSGIASVCVAHGTTYSETKVLNVPGGCVMDTVFRDGF